MRKAISAAGVLVALAGSAAFALPANVARIDAYARAAGSDKAAAVRIGERLFLTEWPVQVLNVYADRVGMHRVVGLRLSGVKFHRPTNRAAFFSEISRVVDQSFVAAAAEEVDVWTTVPLSVGKGTVVAGDLARPTSRIVFTVSVRRGETGTALLRRLSSGRDVFLDEEWARSSLK